MIPRSIPAAVWIFGGMAVLLDLLVLPGLLIMAIDHHAPFTWEPWFTLPPLLASSFKSTYLLFCCAILGGSLWFTRTEWSTAPKSSLATGKFRERLADLVQGGWTPWKQPLKTPPPAGSGGLILGMDAPGTGYLLTADEHSLIIGSTGSRKTSNVILPSIGVLGMAGESLIVTDPKGELVQTTGEWLRDRGYQVIRHDYRVPSLGQRSNPMDSVVEAFHPYPNASGETPDPDWITASQRAAQLATALVGDQVGSEGPMWRDWSRDLIAASICAVADWADLESRNLASVAHLITGEQEPEFLDHFFGRFPADHPARIAYASIRNSRAENRASILSTTGSKVGLFRQGAIAWMTAHSDYALADVGRRKMAIFLVFPPNDSTFHSLITIYLHQMLRALSDLAFRSSGRRLPIRVNGILDEFGSFPSIPDFEKTLATCRSEGIRMNLVIQSYKQLATAYPNGRDGTLQDNCNTTVFLSTNDIETAQRISNRLGQIAVQTRGQSFDRSQDGRITETTNETTRALLTPDEIMNSIPRGTNLILQSQQHPARMTMHRVQDYVSFQWRESPDPEPPAVKAPPLWPGDTLPEPGAALDPVEVVDGQVPVPDDARVVGRDWNQVFETS